MIEEGNPVVSFQELLPFYTAEISTGHCHSIIVAKDIPLIKGRGQQTQWQDGGMLVALHLRLFPSLKKPSLLMAPHHH